MKKILLAGLAALFVTGCELPSIKGDDFCVAWNDGQCLGWDDADKLYQDGIDGIDGMSAYELAVVGGFSGTEPEWRESLIGAAGLNGADGINGFNGDKGDKGDEGEKGDAGEKGESGDSGTDGTNGVDGNDGNDGDAGTAGVDGVDGVDGEDGLRGLSNYDLAVLAGFEGTLEDWLVSLVGAKGEDGMIVMQVPDKLVVPDDSVIVTFHTRIVGLSGMEVGLVKDGALLKSEPANVVRSEDGVFSVSYIVDINDTATYMLGMQFIK